MMMIIVGCGIQLFIYFLLRKTAKELGIIINKSFLLR